MSNYFFVTGTDTECGKTYVSCQLLNLFNQQGIANYAIKPVAAGVDEQGLNEDALLLQQYAQANHSYSQVNPFCFDAPVSPHIAHQWQGASFDIAELKSHIEHMAKTNDGIGLIEGAGGLCVPLDNQHTWVDFLKMLPCPVIVVVGMKLGCLNHTFLTHAHLREQGIEILGWIANQIDPDMLAYQENLDTLKSQLTSPMLGEVKYNSPLEPTPDFLAMIQNYVPSHCEHS